MGAAQMISVLPLREGSGVTRGFTQRLSLDHGVGLRNGVEVARGEGRDHRLLEQVPGHQVLEGLLLLAVVDHRELEVHVHPGLFRLAFPFPTFVF